MKLETAEAIHEHENIASHFSGLCVAAVDPVGRGDLQSSTYAGLAPRPVSTPHP